MIAERLDIRLDSERKRKLAELAESQGASISEVVRTMIDRDYEDILRKKRQEAARRLIALEVEDVPDPDTLSRQLEAAHDPGDLY
jgi:hypothetical protein